MDARIGARAPAGLVIVEDDPLLAWALRALMEDRGFSVMGTSATEDEAVTSVLSLEPAAVIMDVRLAGGGSGVAAARTIRRTSRVPIIFYTAYADLPDLAEGMKSLGNVRLVGKPGDQELCRLLEAVVRRPN